MSAKTSLDQRLLAQALGGAAWNPLRYGIHTAHFHFDLTGAYGDGEWVIPDVANMHPFEWVAGQRDDLVWHYEGKRRWVAQINRVLWLESYGCGSSGHNTIKLCASSVAALVSGRWDDDELLPQSQLVLASEAARWILAIVLDRPLDTVPAPRVRRMDLAVDLGCEPPPIFVSQLPSSGGPPGQRFVRETIAALENFRPWQLVTLDEDWSGIYWRTRRKRQDPRKPLPPIQFRAYDRSTPEQAILRLERQWQPTSTKDYADPIELQSKDLTKQFLGRFRMWMHADTTLVCGRRAASEHVSGLCASGALTPRRAQTLLGAISAVTSDTSDDPKRTRSQLDKLRKDAGLNVARMLHADVAVDVGVLLRQAADCWGDSQSSADQDGQLRLFGQQDPVTDAVTAAWDVTAGSSPRSEASSSASGASDIPASPRSTESVPEAHESRHDLFQDDIDSLSSDVLPAPDLVEGILSDAHPGALAGTYPLLDRARVAVEPPRALRRYEAHEKTLPARARLGGRFARGTSALLALAVGGAVGGYVVLAAASALRRSR